MRRGEVWRARLPDNSGHAQAGERPVVIVQINQVTRSLSTVLAIPFTSKQAALRYPSTILIEPDDINGLSLPSVALPFQLSVLDKRNLAEKLGELKPETLQQIIEQIHWLIDA